VVLRTPTLLSPTNCSRCWGLYSIFTDGPNARGLGTAGWARVRHGEPRSTRTEPFRRNSAVSVTLILFWVSPQAPISRRYATRMTDARWRRVVVLKECKKPKAKRPQVTENGLRGSRRSQCSSEALCQVSLLCATMITTPPLLCPLSAYL
jgi:hypothetical protein